jgi:hypothetical protein
MPVKDLTDSEKEPIKVPLKKNNKKNKKATKKGKKELSSEGEEEVVVLSQNKKPKQDANDNSNSNPSRYHPSLGIKKEPRVTLIEDVPTPEIFESEVTNKKSSTQ